MVMTSAADASAAVIIINYLYMLHKMRKGLLSHMGAVPYHIFLFFNKNICCGYSLEAPQRGASYEYPQHMFSWSIKKKISTLRLKKKCLISNYGEAQDQPAYYLCSPFWPYLFINVFYNIHYPLIPLAEMKAVIKLHKLVNWSELFFCIHTTWALFMHFASLYVK